MITAVEQLIADARNSPECFKCSQPITEFDQVRIVTVRVDGEPMNVWVHADHAKPSPTQRVVIGSGGGSKDG